MCDNNNIYDKSIKKYNSPNNDIVDKIYDLTFNLDICLENKNDDLYIENYNIFNITNIFTEIKRISEQIFWKDLIKVNFNEKFKCTPDIYLYYFELFDELKLKYNNYFKTNFIIVDDLLNYHFVCAIVIFLTYSNTWSIEVCNWINKIIPNYIHDNIIKILKIINCDKIIWNDKIEKGIIVEIKYKNDFGDIIKIIYEEHPEIYDFYYNNLLK
jgi:hypothetical protein